MPDPVRCLSAPTIPPAPPLPFPITAALPKIAISFNPKFCCKLPSFSVKIAPTLPPLILNPALTFLKKARGQINAFLDQIQIRCPRE